MPVNIGDVGFIRGGKFHRLFNALSHNNPEDDQCDSDVPEGHKPLAPIFGDHLTESPLNSGQYCSSGVRVRPELPQFSSGYYF
jgi:hypothetical protein